MDRREFLSLSAAITAAMSARQTSLFTYPFSSENEPQSVSASKPPVRIISKFMEEYVPGKPSSPNPGRSQSCPFIAKDGSFHFLTVIGGGVKKILWHLYPSPDSVTGWDVKLVPLPPDSAAGSGNVSALIITPGRDGAPDDLWIRRPNSIQKASIAKDGTIGDITSVTTVLGLSALFPLVSAQQPTGTRYILETNYANQYFIRDMASPNNAYYAGNDAFSYKGSPFRVKQFFPLKDGTEGYLRCVVVTETGNVFYLLLTLTRLGFNGIVSVRDKQLLGTSEMGLVYVHEEVAGEFEVVLVDLPGGKTINGRYKPGATDVMLSDIGSERTKFTLPDFDLKMLKPDRKWSLKGAWNPYAKTVELFVLFLGEADYLVNIWTTTRKSDLSWEPLSPLEQSCDWVGICPAQGLKLVILKESTGFQIFDRNEDGEWDIDYLRIPSEGEEMMQIGGYRVGIELNHNGMPLAGETISVVCSEPSPALIGDKHVVFAKNRATPVTTDASGVAWFTILLENRLCFPSLIVRSPRMNNDLKVNLNAGIEDFFINLTETQVRNARDPRTKALLLQDDDKKDVAGAVSTINKLMQYQKDEEKRSLNHPGELIHSDVAAHWIPRTSGGTGRRANHFEYAPSTRISYHPDNCWSMELIDGVASFATLTREEAQLKMARLLKEKSSLPAPPGIFDDIFDCLANVAHMVWDGVTKVTEAVIKGGQFVLKMVIAGVDFIIDGILDTIERVMDAISIVLNFVGFALGLAINWVLELFDGLFDWKEIKRRRDLMKTLLLDNAWMMKRFVPDPKTGAQYLETKLNDLRIYLNQYRSSGAAAKRYGFEARGFSSMPDMFSSIRSVTVLPQVTWLMDKLADRLFAAQASDPLVIDGLGKWQAEVLIKLEKSASDLGFSIDDVQTLMVSWATNADIFSSAAFQPLLDLVIGKLDSFISLVRDVITAVGEMLHVLWENPDKVMKWMDAEVPLPFLNGFYEGLAGKKLSVLDVFCLLVSIHTKASGQDVPKISGNLSARMIPEESAPFAMGEALDHSGAKLQPASFGAPGFPLSPDTKAELVLAAKILAGSTMAIGVAASSFDVFFIALGRKAVLEKEGSFGGQSYESWSGIASKLNLCANISCGGLLAYVASQTEDGPMIDTAREYIVSGLSAAGILIVLKMLPILDRKLFPDPSLSRLPRREREGYTRATLADICVDGLNIYFLVKAIENNNPVAITRNVLRLTQSLMITGLRQYAEHVKAPSPQAATAFGVVTAVLSGARFVIFEVDFALKLFSLPTATGAPAPLHERVAKLT
jgi:hypothetical protein